MTDRINAIVVTLERDLRIDDAEPLLAAIKQLRGVLNVEPNVAEWKDRMAEDRALTDVRRRVYGALESRP